MSRIIFTDDKSPSDELESTSDTSGTLDILHVPPVQVNEGIYTINRMTHEQIQEAFNRRTARLQRVRAIDLDRYRFIFVNSFFSMIILTLMNIEGYYGIEALLSSIIFTILSIFSLLHR